MSFSNDLRHSVRTMLRAPGLASALVVSVALGLGSNTVLVGFVRGFGANELPIPGIETLVSIFEVDESGRWGPVSYERYLALEARQDVFRGVGAARDSRVTFVVDGRTSIVSATAITDELADILGLPVRDGAVLSHRLWRGQLGGQSEVRGRTVRIDDRPGQVAGVARQGFEGLYNDSAVDVWMALILRNIALLKQPGMRARALRALGANSETFTVYLFAHFNFKAEQQKLQKRLRMVGPATLAQEGWERYSDVRVQVRGQGFEMPELDYLDLLAAAEHVQAKGWPKLERLRKGVFEYLADRAEPKPGIVQAQLDPLLEPCAYGLWDECPTPIDCKWLAQAAAETGLIATVLAALGIPELAAQVGIMSGILAVAYAELCDPLAT